MTISCISFAHKPRWRETNEHEYGEEKCKHEKTQIRERVVERGDWGNLVECGNSPGTQNRTNEMAVSLDWWVWSSKKSEGLNKSNKRQIDFSLFFRFSTSLLFFCFLLSWQWLLILRLFSCYFFDFFSCFVGFFVFAALAFCCWCYCCCVFVFFTFLLLLLLVFRLMMLLVSLWSIHIFVFLFEKRTLHSLWIGTSFFRISRSGADRGKFLYFLEWESREFPFLGGGRGESV